MADPFDRVTVIAEESARFTAALPDDLSSPVPSCPGWDSQALVEHLGEVQRFWAVIIDAGGEQPGAMMLADAPTARAGLIQWFTEGTQELIDAIGRAEPDDPAWTWWGEPATAGAVARHQVQEAAVHRVDAELVSGTFTALDPKIADDGVGEFLEVMLDVPAGQPAPQVRLRATDTGREWEVSAGPVATASGTASELVLALYGRIGLDTLTVDGDRAMVERLLSMTSASAT